MTAKGSERGMVGMRRVASGVVLAVAPEFAASPARTLILGLDETGRIVDHDRPAADLLDGAGGSLLGTEFASLVTDRLQAELFGQGARPGLSQTRNWVISELVTNAVRYSRGNIGLHLVLGDGLFCEVRDHSAALPRLREAGEEEGPGWGCWWSARSPAAGHPPHVDGQGCVVRTAAARARRGRLIPGTVMSAEMG